MGGRVTSPERTGTQVDWSGLMEVALNQEGSIGSQYQRFYNYSTLNMLFLLAQGCPLEPIANYQRWKDMGRQVKRGSKAYSIIRPITVKREDEATGEEKQFRRFKDVRCIFPYSMTEGDDLPPAEPREWSKERALGSLGISQVAFELFDGNCMGYSFDRNVAVSPVAAYPTKTLLHEIGHVEHGHTTPEPDIAIHRGTAEFQAESTAYIVLHELGEVALMNVSESRGYIRSWLKGERPSDQSIRQVFSVVDRILKAGRPAVAESEDQVA